MARQTTAFRSDRSQRVALEILRGHPRRRKREPTEAELARERRFFDELAELMEAGVLVDRCELVPEEADDEDQVGRSTHVALELW
jgi:hypothetical protein